MNRETGSRRWLPALVPAIVPLVLIPCTWLWWWAATLRHGIAPGRSADLLLVIGAGAAAWLVHRRGAAARPALPLLLALAWQALALALWAPVRDPGLIWLVERAAALAAAVGLAAWLTPAADDDGRPRELAAAGLAWAGLGILATTCLAAWLGCGDALRIGDQPPFGNVNFDVGAALPLAAIAVMRVAQGAWRWLGVAVPAVAGAVLLAHGIGGTDPCGAAAVVGGSALVAIAILRLPPRAHPPLFAAAVVLAIAGWLLAASGDVDAGRLGAGAAQRPWLWRSAGEALANAHAAVGYGPGATTEVLVRQPSFAGSWLTVPSYAEHAHCEPLQVLLDGGAVLAALLAWALRDTLLALWRRRAEPWPAALLVGWAAAGAHALIESHLAQPGGLLMLAMLAGVSWAWAAPSPLGQRATAIGGPVLAGMALAALIIGELFGGIGTPPELQSRCDRRISASTDPAEQLAALDDLRARVGPLSLIDFERCLRLGRLGRHDEAAAALAGQLTRLPVHPQSLALAARMRHTGRATPELAAAEATARQRAAAVLPRVRETERNREQLAALRRELERDRRGDPAPAR